MTARPMLENELSMMVMSLASLATDVPSPMDRPTWAAFRAGASLVPSPVTATTSPRFCRASTSRRLSMGRARAMIFRSVTRSSSSSSERAANSGPVMMLRSPSASVHKPIWRPISRAVPVVSPVTIFTCMPASRHSRTAGGTSARTGSLMATRAAPSNLPQLGEAFSASIASSILRRLEGWGGSIASPSRGRLEGASIATNAKVRMACCCQAFS